jgi:hypothetical protein
MLKLISFYIAAFAFAATSFAHCPSFEGQYELTCPDLQPVLITATQKQCGSIKIQQSGDEFVLDGISHKLPDDGVYTARFDTMSSLSIAITWKISADESRSELYRFYTNENGEKRLDVTLAFPGDKLIQCMGKPATPRS